MSHKRRRVSVNVLDKENTDNRNLSFNDDAAERKRLSFAQAEKQQLHKPKLTHDEYMQILDKTLALSQAGKINHKNAWGLELNDHLAAVVSESAEDGQTTNFQRASCTLDASVKIYSVRVDSVHNQTFQILGGLTRTNKSRKNSNQQESKSDSDADEDEEELKDKRKKRSVKTSTLVTNVEIINAKDKDFQSSLVGSAVFSILKDQSGDLFLDSLEVNSDGGLFWEKDESEPSEDISITIGLLDGLLPQIDVIEKAPICNELMDLQKLLHNTDHVYQRADCASMEHKDIKPEKVETDIDFHFNPNQCRISGSYDDFATAFSDDEGASDPIGQPDSYEWATEDADIFEEKEQAKHIVKVLKSLKITGKNEYTWADVDSNKGWTANSFWKFQTSVGKQEKKEKKPKKKTKRKPKYIDFNAPPIDEKDLEPPPRSLNVLTSAASRKMWNSRKSLLIQNDEVQVKEDMLCRLFLKKSDHVVARNSKGIFVSKTISGEPSSVPPLEDYGGDDYDDDIHIDDYSTTEDPKRSISGDLELIAKPQTTSKIDIHFARSAKKVDVRVLKHFMWERVETAVSVKDEDPTTEICEVKDIPEQKSFQSTIDSVSERLPVSLAKNVSVPFYFICLLHLANEHNLQLEAGRELGDFCITKSEDFC